MLTRTIPFKWGVLSLALLLAVAVAPYIQNQILEIQTERQPILEQRYQTTVAENQQLKWERHLKQQWDLRKVDLEWRKRQEEEVRELRLGESELARAIVAETRRDLIAHLHQFQWSMARTSATEGAWTKCYDHPNNPRVIRLLGEYRADPEPILPVLRARFLELQSSFEAVGTDAPSALDAKKDYRVAATAIVYLLSEFGDYLSLPLIRGALVQDDDSRQRLQIIPSDMGVYGMYELCKRFPGADLTADQQELLDQVLEKGEELDTPIETKVAGWEDLVPGSARPGKGWDTKISGHPFIEDGALIIRRWPLTFKEPEIEEKEGWPRFVFQMSHSSLRPTFLCPRAKDLLDQIDAFVREVFPLVL